MPPIDDIASGNFRFELSFAENRLSSNSSMGTKAPAGGAFSECTGLEATMAHKEIHEGGLNYGTHLRAGQVTFATVILRRGMTVNFDLWKWFKLTTEGGTFTYRMDVQIVHLDIEGNSLRRWQLARALPVKFKTSDLNARGGEIAIEELHLMHEGLHLLT